MSTSISSKISTPVCDVLPLPIYTLKGGDWSGQIPPRLRSFVNDGHNHLRTLNEDINFILCEWMMDKATPKASVFSFAKTCKDLQWLVRRFFRETSAGQNYQEVLMPYAPKFWRVHGETASKKLETQAFQKNYHILSGRKIKGQNQISDQLLKYADDRKPLRLKWPKQGGWCGKELSMALETRKGYYTWIDCDAGITSDLLHKEVLPAIYAIPAGGFVRLDLCMKNIGHQDLKALTQLILEHPVIYRMRLQEHREFAECTDNFEPLVQLIAEPSSLYFLDIKQIGLNETGIAGLAQSIEKNKSLKFLYMCASEMSRHSALGLMNAVKSSNFARAIPLQLHLNVHSNRHVIDDVINNRAQIEKYKKSGIVISKHFNFDLTCHDSTEVLSDTSSDEDSISSSAEIESYREY